MNRNAFTISLSDGVIGRDPTDESNESQKGSNDVSDKMARSNSGKSKGAVCSVDPTKVLAHNDQAKMRDEPGNEEEF